jgi:hypothetical protein
MREPRLLVASLSFEERCVHALRQGASDGYFERAVFLDYESRATSGSDAASIREANWRSAEGIAQAHGVEIERLAINPYSMGDAQRELVGYGNEHEAIAIDLSCMTRPHLLAAARATVDQGNAGWEILYTSPWSYGRLNTPDSSSGWRDTLLLPLGEDPSFRNEGITLGVFVPGSEASRATVAFNEVEPGAGLILRYCRRSRPDVYRATFTSNRNLIEYLQMLRVPGPLGREMEGSYPFGRWQVETAYAETLVADVVTHVGKVILAARYFKAPIVLFPIGPKFAVFVAAFVLMRDYSEASWAVYPVARTHPLDYSDGCDALHHLNVGELLATTEETVL